MPPKSCAECRRRRISCVDLTTEGCATCVRRKVRCPGPPDSKDFVKHRRVRKGQRMSELRLALGTSEEVKPTLDVATATSPASRLLTFELAAALHHHLLCCAREVGQRAIPGTALDPLAYQLHPDNFRRTTIEASPSACPGPATCVALNRRPPVLVKILSASDLVHACFAAFGARWSTHSAIIGSGAALSDHSGDLGVRREGPCHALIDRAIAIAEESGLFDLRYPSIKRARAVHFLRQTISMVAPTHPSLPRILRIVHELRIAALSDPESHEEQWVWDNPLNDIPVVDARYSIWTDTECCFTDEELALHYDWSPAKALKSVEHFKILTSRPWIGSEMVPGDLLRHAATIGVYVDRSLVSIKQRGHFQPPLELFLAFTALIELVDVGINCGRAKMEQVLADPDLLRDGWVDLICGQYREDLMWITHACGTVERLAHRNTAWAESELSTEIRHRLERRLIQTLKGLLDTPTLRDIDETNRLIDIAPLFASMDLTHDWLAIAVSATQPHSHLYALGFGKEDLARLENVISRISLLYAAGSLQASLLRTHLAMMSDATSQLMEVSERELASKIIDEVVDGLQA